MNICLKWGLKEENEAYLFSANEIEYNNNSRDKSITGSVPEISAQIVEIEE